MIIRSGPNTTFEILQRQCYLERLVILLKSNRTLIKPFHYLVE